MAMDSDRQAARRLTRQVHQVGRVSGQEPWREVLQWITRGRLGRRTGPPDVPQLDTPWQDTLSPERTGWRQRAANLHGEPVFEVDYQICPRCRLGWIEQPYTLPPYQRCGLAAAGLAALRAEYPGLTWHTLGGHLADSRLFWAAVGTGVCPAATSNGSSAHTSAPADETPRDARPDGVTVRHLTARSRPGAGRLAV
ncbi:hypothetical protein [Streptomyces milbemycinicus]|uniref:hypothetical protein n=1 Tax=Streptomyces milbemycinicus TaxID=476552 RepID=UPI0033CF6A5C